MTDPTASPRSPDDALTDALTLIGAAVARDLHAFHPGDT